MFHLKIFCFRSFSNNKRNERKRIREMTIFRCWYTDPLGIHFKFHSTKIFKLTSLNQKKKKRWKNNNTEPAAYNKKMLSYTERNNQCDYVTSFILISQKCSPLLILFSIAIYNANLQYHNNHCVRIRVIYTYNMYIILLA